MKALLLVACLFLAGCAQTTTFVSNDTTMTFSEYCDQLGYAPDLDCQDAYNITNKAGVIIYRNVYSPQLVNDNTEVVFFQEINGNLFVRKVHSNEYNVEYIINN